MQRGLKVEGGDRLGKTIIFARTKKHAEFIVERFNKNYPHHKGKFAEVIHSDITYAESLLDDFSEADKQPTIAVSVDMLDTGIDVPEVVNLMFFKPVFSRVKFNLIKGRFPVPWDVRSAKKWLFHTPSACGGVVDSNDRSWDSALS